VSPSSPESYLRNADPPVARILDAVEIEGRLVTAPFPLYRAYGSVLGGSIRLNLGVPLLDSAKEARGWEVRIGESLAALLGFGVLAKDASERDGRGAAFWERIVDRRSTEIDSRAV
jgi:hypothetical protein